MRAFRRWVGTAVLVGGLVVAGLAATPSAASAASGGGCGGTVTAGNPPRAAYACIWMNGAQVVSYGNAVVYDTDPPGCTVRVAVYFSDGRLVDSRDAPCSNGLNFYGPDNMYSYGSYLRAVVTISWANEVRLTAYSPIQSTW